jgi:dihydrolipoamide dehydrogenase
VLEADGKHIWTYKEAMTPTAIPASLLVIGAGAIGIEFASFYAAFGTKVTVVEAQDRILPVEDADISAIAQKALQKRGLELLIKAKVEDLKATKDGVSAKVNGEVRSFDRAILAIGVQGNIEGLGLEDLGIKTERGSVVVDDYYRTNVEGVWAIGDVAGAPWLAHVASHEGVICAEAIAGKNPHKMDYASIPGCTYCTPQIGSVGMTEAAAREAGKNVKVGRYNYQANGKAIAIGEPEGLVKTIFDADTGELLGAHIVGAEATEMISTYQVAKGLEATDEAFAQICLPHPTLSEMLGESVLDSLGRVLNA